MARANTSSPARGARGARLHLLTAGLASTLLGCSHGGAGGCQSASPGGSGSPNCPTLEVEGRATVQADALDETSGLAAAGSLPGVFWAHNDSGDAPRLYALSRDGSLRGQVLLDGADAVDWEDMAAAPGTAGAARDLIVGDIGDNFAARDAVQIYRIAEPSAGQLGGRVKATRHDVAWPDGPRDMEALFVDPLDGSVYLVEKRSDGEGSVFRVELSSPRPTPSRVGSVKLRTVTAADMSPDGRHIVVRNYHHAVLYDRAPGQSVAEALAAPGCPLSLPRQPQGEAIAFVDDHTLVTLSERTRQPLYLLELREPKTATSQTETEARP